MVSTHALAQDLHLRIVGAKRCAAQHMAHTSWATLLVLESGSPQKPCIRWLLVYAQPAAARGCYIGAGVCTSMSENHSAEVAGVLWSSLHIYESTCQQFYRGTRSGRCRTSTCTRYRAVWGHALTCGCTSSCERRLCRSGSRAGCAVRLPACSGAICQNDAVIYSSGHGAGWCNVPSLLRGARSVPAGQAPRLSTRLGHVAPA